MLKQKHKQLIFSGKKIPIHPLCLIFACFASSALAQGEVNSLEPINPNHVTSKTVMTNTSAIKAVQKEIGDDGVATIQKETDAAKIVDFCKRKENKENEKCIDLAATSKASEAAKAIALQKAVAPAGSQEELNRLIQEREAQISTEIAHRRQMAEMFGGRLQEYAKEAERNPIEQAELMRAGSVSMRQYTYTNTSKLTADALAKEREENERLKAELALLGTSGTVNQSNAQSTQAAMFIQSAQRIMGIASSIADTAKTIDRMGDAQENMLDRLRNEQATMNLMKQTGIYRETAGESSVKLNIAIPAEQALALGFADVKEKTRPDGTYLVQGDVSAARGAGTRTIAEYEQQLPQMISAQKESLAYIEMQRNNMTELANLYNARAVVLEARGGNAQAAARVMQSASSSNSGDYSTLAGIAGLVGIAGQMRGKNGGSIASGGQSSAGGKLIIPEALNTPAKNTADNKGTDSKSTDTDKKKDALVASGASSAVQVVKGSLQNKANALGGIQNQAKNAISGASGKSLGAGGLDQLRGTAFDKKVPARLDASNNSLGGMDAVARANGGGRGPAISDAEDGLGGLVQSLLGGFSNSGNADKKAGEGNEDGGRLLAGTQDGSAEQANLDVPLFARVKEKLTQLEQKGEITSSQKGKL